MAITLTVLEPSKVQHFHIYANLNQSISNFQNPILSFSKTFILGAGLVNLRNLQVLDLTGNRISAGSVTRLGKLLKEQTSNDIKRTTNHHFLTFCFSVYLWDLLCRNSEFDKFRSFGYKG